ncbi:hypothetical protein AAHA92_06443 [Salvia divinorum]|uniref:Secreted protein n=1 Tax=Salvia divinorum TaxID=28513 RepID=A0ABD1I968_SALDI
MSPLPLSTSLQVAAFITVGFLLARTCRRGRSLLCACSSESRGCRSKPPRQGSLCRCCRLAPQPPLLRRRSASHRGLSLHRLSSSWYAVVAVQTALNPSLELVIQI